MGTENTLDIADRCYWQMNPMPQSLSTVRITWMIADERFNLDWHSRSKSLMENFPSISSCFLCITKDEAKFRIIRGSHREKIIY